MMGTITHGMMTPDIIPHGITDPNGGSFGFRGGHRVGSGWPGREPLNSRSSTPLNRCGPICKDSRGPQDKDCLISTWTCQNPLSLDAPCRSPRRPSPSRRSRLTRSVVAAPISGIPLRDVREAWRWTGRGWPCSARPSPPGPTSSGPSGWRAASYIIAVPPRATPPDHPVAWRLRRLRVGGGPVGPRLRAALRRVERLRADLRESAPGRGRQPEASDEGPAGGLPPAPTAR
jgi:hypothetical protein